MNFDPSGHRQNPIFFCAQIRDHLKVVIFSCFGELGRSDFGIILVGFEFDPKISGFEDFIFVCVF